MPSKKSPLPFSQSDLRLFMRILPLLKSWKLVLLLIVVAFAVRYARNLADNRKPDAGKNVQVAAGKTVDREPQPKTSRESATSPIPPESASTSRESNGDTIRESSGEKVAQRPQKNSPPGILDLTDLRGEEMKVSGVVIKDLSGKVVYRGTVDLKPTLERIDRGRKLSYSHDGTVFGNRERLLPQQGRDHYREWVHPTQGLSGPGPQRVVTGKTREIYYTHDHYETFHKIR